ncbi:MAG: hypothetical protein IT290_11210, partial [Deltaproteobacteria bacterium]|nr:hypothetical protein [Deltaproteobacteria bacterium]
QFVTPFGLSIVSLNRANFEISRELLRITEWLPAYDPSVRIQMSVYWLSLVISLALLARLRLRVRASDLFTFLVFALFALLSARMALFYSVAMVPVWTRWVEAALPTNIFRFTFFSSPGSRIGGTVLALAVCAIPPVLQPIPPFLPQAPIALAEKLKTLQPLRVYNYREWAGLLAFFAGPDIKLSMDGRLYLSPKGKWSEYHDAALGRLDPTQLALVNETNVFFLHRGYHAGLVERLEQNAQWQLLFAEGDAVVYVRKS